MKGGLFVTCLCRAMSFTRAALRSRTRRLRGQSCRSLGSHLIMASHYIVHGAERIAFGQCIDHRTNRMQRTPRLRLGFMAGVSGAGSLIRDVRHLELMLLGGVEQKATKRTKRCLGLRFLRYLLWILVCVTRLRGQFLFVYFACFAVRFPVPL